MRTTFFCIANSKLAFCYISVCAELNTLYHHRKPRHCFEPTPMREGYLEFFGYHESLRCQVPESRWAQVCSWLTPGLRPRLQSYSHCKEGQIFLPRYLIHRRPRLLLAVSSPSWLRMGSIHLRKDWKGQYMSPHNLGVNNVCKHNRAKCFTYQSSL